MRGSYKGRAEQSENKGAQSKHFISGLPETDTADRRRILVVHMGEDPLIGQNSKIQYFWLLSK
jgi:hypothetical protein